MEEELHGKKDVTKLGGNAAVTSDAVEADKQQVLFLASPVHRAPRIKYLNLKPVVINTDAKMKKNAHAEN